MRTILFVSAFAILFGRASAEKRLLTAIDAVETVRLLSNPGFISSRNPDGAVSFSPNEKRYVVRLVRGDYKRNGVILEVHSGLLSALATAGNCEKVVELFGTGYGPGEARFFGPQQDTDEYRNPMRWLDDDRIAFLWSDASGTRQVVVVDLITHKVKYLTRHPTPVGSFDISDTGVVFYNAEAKRTEDPGLADKLKNGFVIPETADSYAVFTADLSGASLLDKRCNTEWFLQEADGTAPKKVRIANRDLESFPSHEIRISPNGLFALIDSAPETIPSAWDKYTQRDIRAVIDDARNRPFGGNGRRLQELRIVNLKTGESPPLWTAGCLIGATQMAWSPDNRFVAVGSTFLPPDKADRAGLEGEAIAVVEVSTGLFQQLPLKIRRYGVRAIRWEKLNELEIIEENEGRDKRYYFTTVDGQWSSSLKAQPASGPAALRFEIRDDLAVTPKLVVVDVDNAQERLVLALNARLTDEFKLGRVERLQGKLETGDAWSGQLFYPVNYDPSHRYPLVIQSIYGATIGTHFTLYGETTGNAGPSLMAPYPGQVLASRDIFVLHLLVSMGAKSGTPLEPEIRRIGFESAVDELFRRGLIDNRKVGLVGFSRNGYYVEYTLTHSKFPFAAAIAADNWDPSYFQQTLIGQSVPLAAAVNGGLPYGDGLKAWLEHAPGFNVANLHTPLRTVHQGSGLFSVFGGWEVFAWARFLKKPIECYVMPEADLHGAHNTQNPGQVVAVMEGSVDWFDFWLNQHEDPDPKKREQYSRWRKLRGLHEEDLRKSEAEKNGKK